MLLFEDWWWGDQLKWVTLRQNSKMKSTFQRICRSLLANGAMRKTEVRMK